MNHTRTCTAAELNKPITAGVTCHEDWRVFVDEMIRFGVISPASHQGFEDWLMRLESVVPPARAS